MNILIILKYIPTEDKEQKSDLIHTIVRGHIEQGHVVKIFTTGYVEQSDYDVIPSGAGFTATIIHRMLKPFSKKVIKWYDAQIIKNVIKVHNSEKFDLILAVCTAHKPALYANLINEITKVPYVVQEHIIYEGRKRSLKDIKMNYLAAIRNANAVVAVSGNLAKIMTDLEIREDIGVIPNGISEEFFEPPNYEETDFFEDFSDWKGESYVFGAWTRWRHIKRLDLLIDAFIILCNDTDNVKLFIGGPIEDFNIKDLESKISDNGLDDKVWIYGPTDRHHIHLFANSVDCCVLPSDYETFGLPALESIAAGKPVVTTKSNGPEYIIDKDILGITVERGCPDQLASAMRQVYDNRNYYNPESIKRDAHMRFSRSSVSQQFTMLYNDILNRNHRI